MPASPTRRPVVNKTPEELRAEGRSPVHIEVTGENPRTVAHVRRLIDDALIAGGAVYPAPPRRLRAVPDASTPSTR